MSGAAPDLIRRMLMAGALMATIGPIGCGEDPTQPCPALERFSVMPQSLSVEVGDSARLAAQIQAPEGESVRVDWGTTDAGVANVSRRGVVHGVAPGEAHIVATSSHSLDGGGNCADALRDSAAVTVLGS